jgi:hypothetical protein
VVVKGHEQAVLIVGDKIAGSGNRCGDYWRGGAHGLGKSVGKTLDA